MQISLLLMILTNEIHCLSHLTFHRKWFSLSINLLGASSPANSVIESGSFEPRVLFKTPFSPPRFPPTPTSAASFLSFRLLVLAGRQDRLRRFRSVYPPFSRKENKMSGIFIDSAQAAPSTIFVDAAPCPIETRSIYILSGEKKKERAWRGINVLGLFLRKVNRGTFSATNWDEYRGILVDARLPTGV